VGEDDCVLTDEEIAGLAPAERRALIARLARPLTDVADPGHLRLERKLRIGVVAAATILLVPWIIYLAIALPGVHRIRNWDVLWVGLDGVELALLALTLWLGWQRRVLVILSAFATGVVLLCDAWFDLLTASPGELWQAVLAAVILEIPLALLLMSGAVRVIRTSAALLWFSDPHTHVWAIRIPGMPGRSGRPSDQTDDA
jgi:hypothetical protein